MGSSVRSNRGVFMVLFAAIAIEAWTLTATTALMRKMPKSSPGPSPSSLLETSGRRRRRRSRRRRRAPTTKNFEFGGGQHGVNTHQSNLLTRPEAVKSKGCNANGCQDCSDRDHCWHGVDAEGWGFLVLDVPSSSIFTHYTAEVWMKCPTFSSSSLWVYLYNTQNGNYKVYKNDNVVDLASFSPYSEDGHNMIRKGFSVGGDTRLRVFLFPVNHAARSYARIYLEAWEMAPVVDSCIGVKNCLAMLGDGRRAAFKLRNDNGVQVKCLSGDLSGMDSALQTKCNQWNQCVTTSGKKPELLALLKAAQPNVVLLEGASVANVTRFSADSSTCVSPDVDDPESYDCECVAEMATTCSGAPYAGMELEECFKTLMCANSNVCCSWKRDHCPSTTCTGALMEERSQVITSRAIDSDTRSKAGLDNSVQGKCVM